MALLEIKNISKIYSGGTVKALQNVSLNVEKGEWVAIMGPSGSGKSTMMNIIGCMDKPSSGQVILDGIDITNENSRNLTNMRRDKIGLVFQQFHLVNYLTAIENVMMAQYYHSSKRYGSPPGGWNCQDSAIPYPGMVLFMFHNFYALFFSMKGFKHSSYL